MAKGDFKKGFKLGFYGQLLLGAVGLVLGTALIGVGMGVGAFNK